MRLSEDKISHLSHLLCDGAARDGLVSFDEPARFLKLTKKILTDYCALDDEVDRLARAKVSSYSRNLVEGSREWEILYRKHFDEEMRKRWR